MQAARWRENALLPALRLCLALCLALWLSLQYHVVTLNGKQAR
jgi:hypothetical protein